MNPNNFQERTIGTYQVRVSKLPAFRGLIVLNALTKLLGPSMEKAGNSFSNLNDIDISKLVGALGDLFSRIDEKDLKFFVDNLLASATLNNAPFLQTFDVVLMGEVDILLECLVFSIETNYQNFIRRLMNKIQETRKIQALAEEETKNKNN